MLVFALLLFLATIANTGIPLQLNWAGELMPLSGIFQRTPVVADPAYTGTVLSACCSIFSFHRISFGAYSQYLIQSASESTLDGGRGGADTHGTTSMFDVKLIAADPN
jgi:NADH:ubiquinone oxidoreductase subunit 4 (subunit M)